MARALTHHRDNAETDVGVLLDSQPCDAVAFTTTSTATSVPYRANTQFGVLLAHSDAA
jgi:hypothetical protein